VAGLPKEFPAAVFLVLHMPSAFTQQFTVQLSEISSLPVKEAESNEAAQPGVIYLCPGAQHLRLSPTGKILLDAGARIDGYRPCADVAFETIGSYARSLAVGVVLTGMSSDGAKGVKAVKAAGGHVIAQDEASSVIFGMPAEAIKTGTVDQVLALDEISAAIDKRVTKLCRLVPVDVR
jgi:two-component system, chemotaxis family, protein-glutamate methylesterase/glutaminase